MAVSYCLLFVQDITVKMIFTRISIVPCTKPTLTIYQASPSGTPITNKE